MKPEFIVILALVLIAGFCLTRYTHDNPDVFGSSSQTMTSSNGNDYEQIVREGKLIFNQDTTAIAALSPGGCFRYTHNNRKMTAEASKEGVITYTFYLDGDKIGFDRQFLTTAIRTTIARKFDK